ncbi:MAG: hypothetical protein Q9227_004359 [Pyrenula ochraceoflavens]
MNILFKRRGDQRRREAIYVFDGNYPLSPRYRKNPAGPGITVSVTGGKADGADKDPYYELRDGDLYAKYAFPAQNASTTVQGDGVHVTNEVTSIRSFKKLIDK